MIASAFNELGSPGVRYWLRTGLPVRASMCGDIEKGERGGRGDELDRPAVLLGELDESGRRPTRDLPRRR